MRGKEARQESWVVGDCLSEAVGLGDGGGCSWHVSVTANHVREGWVYQTDGPVLLS